VVLCDYISSVIIYVYIRHCV